MTFDEKLDELFQDLLRARDTYEAWWNLKNRKVRPKYVDTMNVYSEYFVVAVHSHFVAMLMVLFRLFDTDKRALSIPTLLASIQSEPGFPAAVKARVAAALERAQPSIAKVKLLRDKVFAHRDRSYSYERAFREAGLTANEVRRLTERTLRMIDALMHARNKGVYSTFEHNTERHLLAMLRDLHAHRRRSAALKQMCRR
jgi:AbiU2